MKATYEGTIICYQLLKIGIHVMLMTSAEHTCIYVFVEDEFFNIMPFSDVGVRLEIQLVHLFDGMILNHKG